MEVEKQGWKITDGFEVFAKRFVSVRLGFFPSVVEVDHRPLYPQRIFQAGNGFVVQLLGVFGLTWKKMTGIDQVEVG